MCTKDSSDSECGCGYEIVKFQLIKMIELLTRTEGAWCVLSIESYIKEL